MSDPTIYLAGPVNALDDGGASWRDALIDYYKGSSVTFANPLSKYNVPAGGVEIVANPSDDPNEVTPSDIVTGDKAMLREADGVLVGYSDVHSIGTPMEVMWAFERDMPVVIWTRDFTPADELSPWYRHHADEICSVRDVAVYHVVSLIDMIDKQDKAVKTDAVQRDNQDGGRSEGCR